jgi:hypothetical protein
MTSGMGNQSFERAWHFVDAADKDTQKTYRLAIRESARRRRWQNKKNGLDAGQTHIAKPGSTPRRKSKDSLNQTDQTSDDDWESDSNGDVPAESDSDSKSSFQKTLRYCKFPISSKNRRPLRTITVNPLLQKPSQSDLPLSLRPRSILGAGRTNPFDTYPAPNSMQKVDILVDFCELALSMLNARHRADCQPSHLGLRI